MHPALRKLATMGLVAGLGYLSIFGIPPTWFGEVVEVETYDPRGISFRTSAWIVEGNGGHWLRAGAEEATWFQRLRARPEIHVTRDGVRAAFRAEVAPGALPRVNVWMREKYGRSDELIAFVRDPADATAIRLVPNSRGRSWGEQYP